MCWCNFQVATIKLRKCYKNLLTQQTIAKSNILSKYMTKANQIMDFEEKTKVRLASTQKSIQICIRNFSQRKIWERLQREKHFGIIRLDTFTSEQKKAYHRQLFKICTCVSFDFYLKHGNRQKSQVLPFASQDTPTNYCTQTRTI